VHKENGVEDGKHGKGQAERRNAHVSGVSDFG
jgi:hypothetical protein